MIERGVDVSYETICRWVDKFGFTYAKRIRSRSEPPSPVWHLDEVYTKINGKTTPNEIVAPIHPKAMPVILTIPEECGEWMSGGKGSLYLQRPLPADKTRLIQYN